MAQQRPLTWLPVGFIHQNMVYMFDTQQEKVYIFPYHELGDLSDQMPSFDVEFIATVNFYHFFDCPLDDDLMWSGGKANGTTDADRLNALKTFVIASGGVLLVILMLVVVLVLINIMKPFSIQRKRPKPQVAVSSQTNSSSSTTLPSSARTPKTNNNATTSAKTLKKHRNKKTSPAFKKNAVW